MNEMTLTHSPQETQQPELYSDKEQRSPFSSRRVILSLIVFALCFIVLSAGPALALRRMASSVQVAGPSEGPGGYSPDVYASAAVTEVVLQQGKSPWINNVPVGPVYTGTKDTYMNKWKPTDNFWSENRLVLGQSGAYRPLVYFDLAPASIPTNAATHATCLHQWKRRSMRSYVLGIRRR
ncbi:MAG: hypothetical protein AMJ93_16485 [Anaerolineae bacterium SM23_84]|nr:MAG: hypothetical protein AMJ93_16485 [Anaerolineae bacterium SM23_84]